MAKQSPVLKQLEMEVQEVDYCEFTTDTVGPIICAGELDAWPDICLGDSGGPLSCRAKDGRWYLRGVASMVDGNCRGVASFTKVSAFLDWITHTISSKYCTRLSTCVCLSKILRVKPKYWWGKWCQ